MDVARSQNAKTSLRSTTEPDRPGSRDRTQSPPERKKIRRNRDRTTGTASPGSIRRTTGTDPDRTKKEDKRPDAQEQKKKLKEKKKTMRKNNNSR